MWVRPKGHEECDGVRAGLPGVDGADAPQPRLRAQRGPQLLPHQGVAAYPPSSLSTDNGLERVFQSRLPLVLHGGRGGSLGALLPRLPRLRPAPTGLRHARDPLLPPGQRLRRIQEHHHLRSTRAHTSCSCRESRTPAFILTDTSFSLLVTTRLPPSRTACLGVGATIIVSN